MEACPVFAFWSELPADAQAEVKAGGIVLYGCASDDDWCSVGE